MPMQVAWRKIRLTDYHGLSCVTRRMCHGGVVAEEMLKFATPDTAIRITVIGKAGIDKYAAVADFDGKLRR